MALLVILAIATIIPFFVDLFYRKMGHGIGMVLAFPISRLLVEKILFGEQFNLSLTQFGNKWLLQLAAFAGREFITFTVALIPSVLVYMWIKKDNKRMKICGSTVLFVFALIIISGGFRYHFSEKAGHELKMAYASGPQKTYYEEPSEDEPDYDENLECLRRTVKEAAANDAKIIVYAEEAFLVSLKEKDRLTEEALRLAKENDIYILICLDVSGDDLSMNEAVFIDNKGTRLSSYRKSYLIPVIEDEYEEGDGVIPSNHVNINGYDYVISYSICFDATFPDYLITTDKETNLYINPSWDWEQIDDLNYRMQGMGAVENGFGLFKPTMDGWSIVTDPYGRVSYKESKLRSDHDEVYYADVPAARTDTLYKKIYKPVIVVKGILVWGMLFDMIRITVISIRKSRRSKKAGSAGEKI